jgi:hypothetical protein
MEKGERNPQKWTGKDAISALAEATLWQRGLPDEAISSVSNRKVGESSGYDFCTQMGVSSSAPVGFELVLTAATTMYLCTVPRRPTLITATTAATTRPVLPARGVSRARRRSLDHGHFGLFRPDSFYPKILI